MAYNITIPTLLLRVTELGYWDIVIPPIHLKIKYFIIYNVLKKIMKTLIYFIMSSYVITYQINISMNSQ